MTALFVNRAATDKVEKQTAAEKSRADKAESKADSYRQKLIALGVDPDAP